MNTLNTKIINPWLFAFLLMTPVIIFIIGYFLKAGDLLAPGFLQNDNPLYISYANQYLDADKVSLFYSNPFNESNNYSKIYFQLQNFLYLILLKTGILPGWVLLLMTCLFSFITFKILIGIHDHLMPESNTRILNIILFAWGGGLLVLFGIPVSLSHNLTHLDNFDKIFLLDPSWGWWGLNIGRSLLFSAEAYYHALFFGGIYLILKRKWGFALLISLLIILSHPFTGVEYLSILCLWILIETIINKNNYIPFWFSLTTLVFLFLHIFYYLFYLNRFPEHASVHQQYSINWNLRYFNIIPAYILVGLFAFLNIFRINLFSVFFNKPINRLFLSWLIATLFLTNHELFIKPMQPLHFTRGYVWSGLFLLGLPALDSFLNKIKKKKILLGIVMLVFLSDNILWITNYWRKASKTHLSVYLSEEENDVLHWLKNHTDNKTLIISSNSIISYMSAVYTAANPWIAHTFTTPFYEKKLSIFHLFIEAGTIDSTWYNKKIIFIPNYNNVDEMKRLDTLLVDKNSIVQIGRFNILTTNFKK